MNIKQKVQVEKLKNEGYSFKEISEKLNVSVGTVKSYFARKDLHQSSVQERQGGLMQHNIMMYQIMSDILKNWLKTGIINKKEYQVMNTRMAEKYGISLSGIFVDNI